MIQDSSNIGLPTRRDFGGSLRGDDVPEEPEESLTSPDLYEPLATPGYHDQDRHQREVRLGPGAVRGGVEVDKHLGVRFDGVKPQPYGNVRVSPYVGGEVKLPGFGKVGGELKIPGPAIDLKA